jgi:hypothetical protein
MNQGAGLVDTNRPIYRKDAETKNIHRKGAKYAKKDKEQC